MYLVSPPLSRLSRIYVEFGTGHVKVSLFSTFALKSLTGARWQDAAPSHCGDIYKNVRWHQVCHTVKCGITRCVSAGWFPTPTFDYHTDGWWYIYSHEGPHSAWVSVSSIGCQSIKHSEQSSWQLDATIGWDDAWLIIRYRFSFGLHTAVLARWLINGEFIMQCHRVWCWLLYIVCTW